jgi:hypothetical protein
MTTNIFTSKKKKEKGKKEEQQEGLEMSISSEQRGYGSHKMYYLLFEH